MRIDFIWLAEASEKKGSNTHSKASRRYIPLRFTKLSILQTAVIILKNPLHFQYIKHFLPMR